MSHDFTYQYLHYLRPYLRDPQKKAYSLLAMTLIATVFFGAFAIRPALATVISLRKEVKDLREVDERLNEKIASLSISQSHYKSSKEDLYLFDIALPNEPEIPELINNLQSLAGKAGTTLENISLEEDSTKRAGLKVNTVKIQLSGGFPEISRFTLLLEKNLRQIKINNIELAKHGDDPQEILNSLLTLEFYNIEN